MLVEACRNGSRIWEPVTIIDNIIRLKNAFPFCSLVWTPCDVNNLFHDMARSVLNSNLSVD